MADISEFCVNKSNLEQTTLQTRPGRAIEDGEVLAKVDRFAFTANNVTYGVVGERIGYWKFFPVAEDGWGIIPVWGFADIVESKCEGVSVGDRLYGYWPMASHLIMQPGKISASRLIDAAPHRAELPPVYNSYSRVNADPTYDQSTDDERMVLYPLYATSFCLYDFFSDNDWFGAERIIIPSASSKTAIGTAYAFKDDDQSPQTLGLTSPKNKAAVDALGQYDDTLVYDDIEDIDAGVPSAIIDMSGNGAVLGRLHKHLGDNMMYTSNVGVTHYDANEMSTDFIRDRSAMFFAPGHIQKRASEWGPGEFEKRAFAFWQDAAVKSRQWLKIEKQSGATAVEKAYRDVLAAKTPADAAWVVSF